MTSSNISNIYLDTNEYFYIKLCYLDFQYETKQPQSIIPPFEISKNQFKKLLSLALNNTHNTIINYYLNCKISYSILLNDVNADSINLICKCSKFNNSEISETIIFNLEKEISHPTSPQQIIKTLSSNTNYLIARVCFDTKEITINYTEILNNYSIKNVMKLPSIEKYANDILSMSSTCPDFKMFLNEFMKYNDIMCHIRKLNKLYEPNNISSYMNENKYFEYKCILTKIQELFNYKFQLLSPVDKVKFNAETLIKNPLAIITGICRYFANTNDIKFASIRQTPSDEIYNSTKNIKSVLNGGMFQSSSYEWIINLSGTPKTSQTQIPLLYVMDTLEHINNILGDKKIKIMNETPFIVIEEL